MNITRQAALKKLRESLERVKAPGRLSQITEHVFRVGVEEGGWEVMFDLREMAFNWETSRFDQMVRDRIDGRN